MDQGDICRVCKRICDVVALCQCRSPLRLFGGFKVCEDLIVERREVVDVVGGEVCELAGSRMLVLFDNVVASRLQREVLKRDVDLSGKFLLRPIKLIRKEQAV